MDRLKDVRKRAAALAAIGMIIAALLFAFSGGHPIPILIAVIGVPLLLYIGIEPARALLEPAQPAASPQIGLRQLAAQIPGVMWTTDRQLIVTGVYGSGLDGSPFTIDTYVGRRISEIMGDRIEPAQVHERALAGVQGQYDIVVAAEHFSVRVSPLIGADGAILGCIGLALNNSERVRIEHELELVNLRLTTLLEAARLMLATPDSTSAAQLLSVVAPGCQARAMALLSCDQRGENVSLLATSTGPVLAKPQPLAVVFHDDGPVDDAVLCARAAAALAELAIDGHPAEAWQIWPVRVGGQLFGAMGAVDAADSVLVKTVADQLALDLQQDRLIEQVREGRERMRTLSQRLVEAQETERRALAVELHDEMGQALTGLTILLDTLALPDEPTLRTQVADASIIVRDLTERVRQISLNLRPGMLDDLGLVPALLWKIERFSARTGIVVNLHQRLADQRLPPPIETAAFRIVQEALTNVARHAQTNEADVSLYLHRNVLVLQIEDRGRGFDPTERDGTRSVGLVGMRERAVLVGGRLRIESAPGEGTQVIAELPIDGIIERRGDTR